MNKHLFTQHDRLHAMLADVDTKIIALADLQQNIFLESGLVSQSNYHWSRANYFTVNEYAGNGCIQCWFYSRTDHDEQFDTFILSPHLTSGHPELYEAVCKAQFEEAVRHSLLAQSAATIAEIKDLEHRLTQLRGLPIGTEG